MQGMEIREFQFTGGSSYVITLPKEWIESEKIKKNDPSGVEIQPDGTLLVTKATEQEPLQRIIESFSDLSYLLSLTLRTFMECLENPFRSQILFYCFFKTEYIELILRDSFLTPPCCLVVDDIK